MKDTVAQAAIDCTCEEELDRVERLIERGADPNVNCAKTHPAYSEVGSYAALKVLHRVAEESLGLQMFQILCRGGRGYGPGQSRPELGADLNALRVWQGKR